ncbi:MAG: 4-hydroxy-tetrahydrodipicolinate synthase [Candidatus Krumholzibacteriota bacterium]|nr:4-hydroxy-tetrahydrodipicolinate synthase [Candidatus Krumholzibacteriota bacterium]
MLHGLFVALVTPFTREGALDEARLTELVRLHVEAGTDGLVPCATTSENPALEDAEWARIVEIAVREAAGRLAVYAGCGTNSTTRSIANIRRARDLGANGAMVVTPYYNKPTQEGLYAHFSALADEGGLPLMLYNVPGRTGVNLAAGTVARLAPHERIVAVKEASGDLEQMSEIVRLCGDRVSLLSGDDGIVLAVLAVGGRGVVSVVGNIVPRDMLGLIDAFERGEMAEALERHLRLLPLCRAMFLETNPMPVKTAMNLLGRDVGEVRLPLVPMRPETRAALAEALAAYGLEPGEA